MLKSICASGFLSIYTIVMIVLPTLTTMDLSIKRDFWFLIFAIFVILVLGTIFYEIVFFFFAIVYLLFMPKAEKAWKMKERFGKCLKECIDHVTACFVASLTTAAIFSHFH